MQAANQRVKQIQDELEHYQDRQRLRPEAVLLQELATIKARLAQSEMRIQKERAERNQALE